MIGEVFNDTYLIEGHVGRGNMGAVYEAKHLRLGRSFALKVLHATLAERSDAWARFQREAQIASKLIHPNIVEVTDYNITDSGLPYLVMELLEGELLGDRLDRLKRFDLEQTGSILRQLAAAIMFAHDQGVVHRDLKPANILLCERDERDDFIKVLDFGVSKVVGTISGLTRTNVTIGTPKYMAPEQAAGNTSKVDRRADIYAMGAILYEMLTGEAPITGGTLNELIFKVMYREPRPPRELRPDLPEGVGLVIEKALAKRAEDRHSSMMELWDEFRQAATGEVDLAALSAQRPAPGPGGTVNLEGGGGGMSQTQTKCLEGDADDGAVSRATRALAGLETDLLSDGPAEEPVEVVTGPLSPTAEPTHLRETLVDRQRPEPHGMGEPAPERPSTLLDETTSAQNAALAENTVLDETRHVPQRIEQASPTSVELELETSMGRTNERVAIEARRLGPQRLAPQQLAPQQLAPQQLAPEQLAPEQLQLAPQQLAPQQLAPAPQRIAPASQQAPGLRAPSAPGHLERWRKPLWLGIIGFAVTAFVLATVIAVSGDKHAKVQVVDAGDLVATAGDIGEPTSKDAAVYDEPLPSRDAAPATRQRVSRSLSLRSTPDEAEVLIDESLVGMTPLRALDIPVEAVTVRVSRSGYESWVKTIPAGSVAVAFDVKLRADVKLRPRGGRHRPRRLRSKPAILQVMTLHRGKPFWADVFIDGRRVGQSPLIVRVKPGRHKLQVRRQGVGAATKLLSLRAGQRSTIRLELR